jgi:hypothetical protein
MLASQCLKLSSGEVAAVALYTELLAKIVIRRGSTYRFYIFPKRIIVFEESVTRGAKCYEVSEPKRVDEIISKMISYYTESPKARCSQIDEVYIADVRNDVTEGVWSIVTTCARYRKVDISNDHFGKNCTFYEDTVWTVSPV